MYRLPSLARLRLVFDDNANRARKILEMGRRELAQIPEGAARIAECYTPPKTWDVRMHCLNALSNSFSGIESLESRDGAWLHYLNVGNFYSNTLIRWQGAYRIGCISDIVENPRNKFNELKRS